MAQKYLTISRHGVYYFQYWIPKYLLNTAFTKRIFRTSLRTRNPSTAKKLARKLIVIMDELEAKYFSNPKDYGEAMVLLQRHKTAQGESQTWTEYEENFLMKMGEWEEYLLEQAFSYDAEKGKRQAERERVIRLEAENQAYKKALEQNISVSIPSSTLPLASSTSNEALSECLEEFVIEKRSTSWKKNKGNRTENKDYRPKIGTFIEIVGDKPVSELTQEDIANYKKVMFILPSNRNKKKAYKNRTINELLEMGKKNEIPDNDKLSKTTLKNSFTKVSSFLSFLIKNSKTGIKTLQEPIQGVISQSDSDSEERDEFSPEDLIKLFESEEYKRHSHTSASHYWIPLLGLFTGARLNELCQLYKKDVDEKSGIHYIDINADKPDKRLKKSYHKRLVPIHKQLIIIGFIDFVEKTKTERLFPELAYGDDGYLASISKWFNRTYRKNCNVGQEDNENKVFHSFRHTFITHLLNEQEVPQYKIAHLVGQLPSDNSETTKRYGKPNSLSDRNRIIQKIKYNINFSKIRKW